jgi:hypothetical protein
MGIWHGDEEEELPGDGPLPPDLQAHADGVLPEVIERPEDPEPWWWLGAAATIGISYQIVAGWTHQADPRLGDVLLVALSQVARHARAAPPEILEQLEQLKADYELVTGREPELLDPSIFELGEEDQ